jgi:DNA-binding NarL/FixJ family response regulator
MDVERITIVIAEEQLNIRKSLRSLIASEHDMEIVGEVNNGIDALDMVGNLRPDILILGLNASNIIEIIRKLNHHFPNTAIIVLRKNDDEEHLLEMMRSGVNIHVLKSASAAKLVNTIRELNTSKKSLISPGNWRTGGKTDLQPEQSTVDPHEILTKREFQVYCLIIGGLTNAKIADRLSISRRTVEIHRANMLRKLGLRNQYRQLVKYAIDREILSDTLQNKSEN